MLCSNTKSLFTRVNHHLQRSIKQNVVVATYGRSSFSNTSLYRQQQQQQQQPQNILGSLGTVPSGEPYDEAVHVPSSSSSSSTSSSPFNDATKSKTTIHHHHRQSTEYSFSEHAKLFEETVLSRYAAKNFIPDKPIPDQVLAHILGLAQRAPTGYNLQPWTAIVVNNEQKKRELYEAALKQEKILQAPVTIVIAANHGRPLENLDTILQQGRESGTMNEEQIDRVRRLAQALLQTGPLCTLQLAKYLFTTAVSMFLKPMMIAPLNMKAYVWKQTMLSVQTLMLAASAHGVQSCPMEGFDERRVKNVVGLPGNYSVPMIVSLGYSNEHLEGRGRSPRINPEKQFFQNVFGREMDHLVSFNNEFDDFLQEFRRLHGDVSVTPAELSGTTVSSISTLPVTENPTSLPIVEDAPPILTGTSTTPLPPQ